MRMFVNTMFLFFFLTMQIYGLIYAVMNKILLSLAVCLCMLKASSQSGHAIRLHLKPYTGGKVYLGYYYGKIKALADSTELNAGSDGVFSGKDRLPGGVYFVVSPNRAILFELL